jgi:DHA2 family multidrug resistance protein
MNRGLRGRMPVDTGKGGPSAAIGIAQDESPAARFFVTCGLMIATAMQAADALIANLALPQLEREFGGGIELGAWVMTSYLCASAILAPLTALLRRRYGARHLFLAALFGFIGSSLLCAVATSGATLIFFRILQGAAGGITLPLSQAVLLDLYPKQRHGRILAVWGAVLMIGPILGPLIGGIVTDLASWRWVFVINLPLGVLAIAGLRGLRPTTATLERVPIDWLSLALLIVAVGALELLLERGIALPWLHSPELTVEAGIIIAACAATVWRVRRVRFTIFSPAVFKDLNFAAAAAYNFLTSGMLFVTIVFLPQLGQGPLGYTATLAGFTIVPRAAFMALMILLVGQLIGHVDYRILLFGGWAIMAGGLGMLSAVEPQNAVGVLIAGSTVQAVGAGLLFTPLSTVAFSTLSPELRTDGSGVYSLLRQLGCASGVALMTAILLAQVDANLLALSGPGAARNPSGSPTDVATLHAYAQCFTIMAVVALAVSPGVFLFRNNRGAQPIAGD